MTKEELYAIAERPISFNLGKYMDEGFQVYKKFAGGFIGILLLSILIWFGLAIIPFIGAIALPFVALILHAGAIITIHKIRNNEHFEFSDFFSGFKKAGPIILWALFIYLLFMICMSPIIIVFINENLAALGQGGSIPNPEKWIWLMLLLFIPIMLIFVFYVFSLQVLVLLNDNVWVAMEASRRVVFKKFFPILGMLILLYIIYMIGTVITLGLGLFVLLPWTNATITMAFEDIFKPSVNQFEQQIDSFGTHQRDINTEAEEGKF
ncbi:MAG TPA: hypothetical protein VNB90_06480 [Cytophagaceae bacterium]|jgi:hypothetical protein|nr:hypothetical protein [Cytophagaceae bacterium]